MASYAQKMTAVAEATGLSYDTSKNIMHGMFHGYSFAFPALPNNARYCYVNCFVTRDGIALTSTDAKQIAKESGKLVEYVKPTGNAASGFLVKLGKDEQTTIQQLTDALDYLVKSFATRGFVNICERCHQPMETEAYVVGNGIRFLCPDCFENVSSDLDDKAHVEAETPENVAAGVIGALLGALLGAAVVVIFGRLGYVTALSGLIAAVCSLKGYELLAKKMSIKGAIISCAAMLIMIYVGHRTDWAIEVAQYFDVDFFKAFRAIPVLIQEEVIDKAQYLKGLLMVVLFALIGAVPTVIKSIKGQKTKYTIQKLN